MPRNFYFSIDRLGTNYLRGLVCVIIWFRELRVESECSWLAANVEWEVMFCVILNNKQFRRGTWQSYSSAIYAP